MFRPAYNNNITEDDVRMAFVGEDDPYKEWFDEKIVNYYFDHPFLCTRLGYTFDDADNGTDYGMSEFVIRQNSEVKVAFTCTIDEMIAQFKAGAIE